MNVFGSGLGVDLLVRRACNYAHTVCVFVCVVAWGSAGTAGLQLGCVSRAQDQTAARIINTSQGWSHRSASVMTSASQVSLKALPVSLRGGSTWCSDKLKDS